jgi:DNA-directed RNA polymerase specialized sigma24 family protein
MPPDESVTRWIDAARAGDPPAAQRLWERYFERLLRVSRRRLGQGARRVADEEDVALSALASFFDGARKGRFPQLTDRNDLWQMLVVIADRKAIDEVQRQRRKKRGGGRVHGESAFDGDRGSDGPRGIEQIVGREPTPEFAALVAEQSERLLAMLGDTTLQRLAQWKLNGQTNAEIAGSLGCSLRSVERKLALIRLKWSELAERGDMAAALEQHGSA